MHRGLMCFFPLFMTFYEEQTELYQNTEKASYIWKSSGDRHFEYRQAILQTDLIEAY